LKRWGCMSLSFAPCRGPQCIRHPDVSAVRHRRRANGLRTNARLRGVTNRYRGGMPNGDLPAKPNLRDTRRYGPSRRHENQLF
jgi:hypothetical protein